LKTINDGLNHLLPAIRDKTKVRMRNKIMQSIGEHQLQNLVNASDDVNGSIGDGKFESGNTFREKCIHST